MEEEREKEESDASSMNDNYDDDDEIDGAWSPPKSPILSDTSANDVPLDETNDAGSETSEIMSA